MNRLFLRRCVVQVGGRSITDLRITFDIKKTMNKDANKCDIKIYNLSPAIRASIVEDKQLVALSAGYGSELSQLFIGRISRVAHGIEGSNYITHIRAEDGQIESQKKEKPETFVDLTTLEIIRALLKKLDMHKTSNFETFAKDRPLQKMSKYVISKSLFDHIAELTKTMGGEVIIESGKAFFMTRGGYVGTEVVKLSASSGLLGSPDLGKKNFITAKCLIQKDLIAGHAIKIEGRETSGEFRIETIKFSGDTHGEDWTATLELSRIVNGRVVEEKSEDQTQD